MNHEINRLIHFAKQNGMLLEGDEDYAVNLLLALFGLEAFSHEDIDETLATPTAILEKMLDYACERGMIENTATQRDLFDNRIMNCVMPRPSEVIAKFRKLYYKDPQLATDDYYHLAIASNYIRKSRTDKNIRWQGMTEYGPIEISINLSKPEKDPKDIAKARLMASSSYPKCLLCKENVGFAGNLQRDGRITHRTIPINLGGRCYFLQYSPYVYYNEHCIVFNEEHVPMQINHQTFVNLLDFVSQFPHYMLGSNADLPIVGGSILSHDHFQGGHYHFPIQDAKVLKHFSFEKYPDVQVDLLYWPLTTIRLTSSNKDEIVALSDQFFAAWKEYSNEAFDIIAYSGDTRHNTITPIARRVGEDYQMDLVLRNNRTSEQYPDGIFHPHQENHHIKKENIGLIEVMGLAILPPRIKTELALLEAVLKHETSFEEHECLEKHRDWYESLKTKVNADTDIEALLKAEVATIFSRVLADAGIFKLNDEAAVAALCEWIEKVGTDK